MSKKVYGIDLGTTYSCIAHVDEHGRAAVIPNSENELTTPSVVYFENESNIVVGNAAKETAEIHPEQVVSTVKRVMGDADWKFENEGKEYTPQEISSFIIEKIVKDVKDITGEDVEDVVITVPAYFGINQKEATKQAGELAGLNVMSVIQEPTAAAIAYGIDSKEDQVVMVYDLGGGTFDITVIDIKDKSIQVVSTGGDHQLGGKNWDETLALYFAQCFEDETGVSKDDLSEDMETWQELLNKAEKAKKDLSSKENTKLRISHDGEKATVDLSREKFDELTSHLLGRTISLTDEILERISEKGFSSVDKLLLVGGSTYMPQVRIALEEKYSFAIETHDPNLSVAKGAAIFGWKLSLEEDFWKIIEDKTGKTKENIVLDEVPEELLEEAKEELIVYSGAIGASPGSVIDLVDTKIQNITAKSFGIELLNENMEEKILNLITVDDEIPLRYGQVFPTAYDGQEGVELICYENIERSGPKDVMLELNTSNEVGRATLEFGRSLPKGSEVEITFSLSEDGLLRVFGKDLTSGREVEASFQTESILEKEVFEAIKEERKALTVS